MDFAEIEAGRMQIEAHGRTLPSASMPSSDKPYGSGRDRRHQQDRRKVKPRLNAMAQDHRDASAPNGRCSGAVAAGSASAKGKPASSVKRPWHVPAEIAHVPVKAVHGYNSCKDPLPDSEKRALMDAWVCVKCCRGRHHPDDCETTNTRSARARMEGGYADGKAKKSRQH